MKKAVAEIARFRTFAPVGLTERASRRRGVSGVSGRSGYLIATLPVVVPLTPNAFGSFAEPFTACGDPADDAFPDESFADFGD